MVRQGPDRLQRAQVRRKSGELRRKPAGLPPEQPSDDGVQELLRRAAAVVERARRPPGPSQKNLSPRSLESPSAGRLSDAKTCARALCQDALVARPRPRGVDHLKGCPDHGRFTSSCSTRFHLMRSARSWRPRECEDPLDGARIRAGAAPRDRNRTLTAKECGQRR
jgi:hypothetical protein